MRLNATAITLREANALEKQGWELRNVQGSERFYYWNVAYKGWPTDPRADWEEICK